MAFSSLLNIDISIKLQSSADGTLLPCHRKYLFVGGKAIKDFKMEIKSLNDFYDFLKIYTEKSKNYIFRGVRNSTFELIPSIGLIQKNGKKFTVEDEIKLLNIFKKRAYPFIKEYLNDDLEILSIGQHHGLPTRLLDWTKNPLAAAYFAVDLPFTKEDSDMTEYSCVYIHQHKLESILEKTFNPFNIKFVKRFIPKHWDKRIIAQGGLFTVHNDPYTPWLPVRLEKILIHHDIRKEIKKIINKFGVNAESLFPDLDGVASHVKWLRSDIH